MLRKRWPVILICAMILIVLAVQEGRRTLYLQWMSILSGRLYPAVSLMEDETGTYLLERWHKYPVKMDNAWEAYLALSQLDKEREIEYCRKSIAAGPDRPETYAAAILAYASRSPYTRPEEQKLQDFPSGMLSAYKTIDRKTGLIMLDLCRRGSNLDPGNSFFDMTKAYVLFGMRRDAEALQAMRSVASKKYYDSYCSCTSESKLKYLNKAGFPRLESQLLTMSLWSYHPILLRKVSYTTVWYAERLYNSENRDDSKQLFDALLRCGILVRQRASSVEEYIASNNVFRATASIWMSREKQSSLNYESAERKNNHKVTSVLRSRGWNDLAVVWENQLSLSRNFKGKLDMVLQDQSHLEIIAIPAIIGVGFLGFQLAVVFLLVYGLTAILLKAMGKTAVPIPELSLAGRIGLGIPVLLLWIISAVFTVTCLYICYLTADVEETTLPSFGLGILPLLGLIALLTGFSILQARRLSSATESNQGSRRLLFAIPAVVMAMLVIYILIGVADRGFPFLAEDASPTSFELHPENLLYAAAVAGMMLFFGAMIKATIWLVGSMPSPGHSWRVARIIAIAVIWVSVPALPAYLSLGRTDDYPVGLEISPSSAFLGIFLVILALIRTAVLRRCDKETSYSVYLLHSIRQGSAFLCKLLLVLYLIVMVIHLPFRPVIVQSLDIQRQHGMEAVKAGQKHYRSNVP